MKTRLFTLLAVFMALSMLSMPAHAEPPTPVSGTCDYTFEILDMREANGNTFRYAKEWETWEGDFEGTAESFFRVTVFSEGGFVNVWLRSTFDGTVDGKSGTMVIQLVGKKPLPEGDWYGQWVIISGTDELADLRGRGTWWGPGYEGPPGGYDPPPVPGARPDIFYEGKIHFEP